MQQLLRCPTVTCIDTVTSLLVILPRFGMFFAYSCFVSYHSSASLLQSLICIWYVEICLCLHPSSKSSRGVNQSLAIIYLSNGLLSPLSYPPLQGSSVLYMATGSSCCLYLIQWHHFKTSFVFLPHHPSAHSLWVGFLFFSYFTFDHSIY